MTTEIHVRFTRTCDEQAVLLELEHALDEWLVARELPFLPLQVDEHTLVVCPPGD